MRDVLTELDGGSLSWTRLMLYLGLHVPLGMIIADSSMLATAHAAAVFGAGLWWGATQNWERAAYVAAYIACAEVLWRMTNAHVPWEFGKYAMAAVLLMALLCARKFRLPALAVLYLCLLAPAVWLTAVALPFGAARSEISFNLSGPLALCVAACFFYNSRLRTRNVYILLSAMIAPVVSILTIAVFHLITKLDISAVVFASDSNFDTSGGFGPNQVSSALGVAAMAAFFYIFVGSTDRISKVLLGIITMAFLVQAALTFSRSGIAMTVGAVAVASLFLMKKPQIRLAFLVVTAAIVVVAAYAILPGLDRFTEDAFTDRFTDPTTTGRGELVADELSMFAAHPLLGVGPGMAKVYRLQRGQRAMAAHTEYTRLLAEHGLFGLTSLLLLFLMCSRNFLRARGARERALVAGFIVWGLLYMLVNAFRLAAPAFLIGLTFASLHLNQEWNAEFGGSGARRSGR